MGAMADDEPTDRPERSTATPGPSAQQWWADDADGDWPAAPPPPAPTAPSARRRERRWPVVLASALVAAVVSAAVAVPVALRAADDGDTEQVARPVSDGEAGDGDVDVAPRPSGDVEQMGIEQIAAQVLPSVAKVDVRDGGQRGSGSAVVLRRDGYLVTNAHVVGDADEVEVTFGDGRPVPAEVVGTAAFTDVAVVRVEQRGLPAATFAEEPPVVGRPTVAIGSPFGLDATVTSGIVSALERDLQTPDPSVTLSGLVQTDAAINPGNSGGALVDDVGRVIGMNTAIVSGTPSNSGVGFAIPSSIVVPIAQRLIADGEVVPGFLGIRGEDVSPEVARQFDTAAGAVVVEVVDGTPADTAGLRQGDIVVTLDGAPIGSMVELSSIVQRSSPGEQVTLGVVRDGDESDVSVTLGERPAQQGQG